jgi:hypothetical protein
VLLRDPMLVALGVPLRRGPRQEGERRLDDILVC